MVKALVVNLLASIVMLWLALDVALRALHFYPSTIPTLMQAGMAIVLALTGLALPRRRFPLLIASSVALGLLGIPAACAKFPGGDDGSGLGWLFVVGGGCVASFFIALVTMIIGIVCRPPRRVLPDQVFAAAQAGRVSPGQSASLPPSAKPAMPQAIPPNRPGGIAAGRKRLLPGHWYLWALLGVPVLYLIWIAAGPISWTTARSERHPGGIEIKSTDRHEVCPYPIPFYHHIDTDHERVLLVNGREVLRTTDYKYLFPSPSGSYVAAEHWLYTGPIMIYSLAKGDWVKVEVDDHADEFPGHNYVYPFHFLRWDGDTSFLVEVTGTDWTSGRRKDYRHIWRIAADTGVRSRVEPPPVAGPAATQATTQP